MTDEKKARRVIDFIQCLRHTKGEFHGKPFKLLPWQEKIIRDVFGTVREDDPTMRQYTTAYIEIPKKQGKALALSTLLPTPQGWKQMGDIQVGDQVFDEAGRPCNVVALSEILTTKPATGSLSGMGAVLKPGSGTCGASKSRTTASAKSCSLPAKSTAGRQHIASAIRETPEGAR